MEAIQRERHTEYMRELRRSREYKDRENKLRVLGRVKEGAVPHVRSLTKYNITRCTTSRSTNLFFAPARAAAVRAAQARAARGGNE